MELLIPWKKFIDDEKPYAVIHTGLSSSVQQICLELSYQNIMNGKYPDNNGFEPKDIPLDESNKKSHVLVSNVDYANVKDILLKNNIPVKISRDANTFICNSLAYLTAKKISTENLSIKHILLHTPWTTQYKTKISLEPGKMFLDDNVLHQAIELLIENI